MWLFTVHGFYSITRSAVDPTKLQIRSRTRAHLENLKLLFDTHDGMPLLGQILHTPAADYAYRIIADPGTVQVVLARLCDELDYRNFKAAAHSSLPKDRNYHQALHRVWDVMYDMQRLTAPAPKRRGLPN